MDMLDRARHARVIVELPLCLRIRTWLVTNCCSASMQVHVIWIRELISNQAKKIALVEVIFITFETNCYQLITPNSVLFSLSLYRINTLFSLNVVFSLYINFSMFLFPSL